MSRNLYLRWGARRNRADDIAARLDLELVAMSGRTQDRLPVPLRYGVQFLRTLSVLYRRRPRVVFSQHTQPFCSLAALLYARTSGAQLVTDCHNGPFVDRIWQLLPIDLLNRYIYRRATINLVHNQGMLEFAREKLGIRGRFEVLWDVIPEAPSPPPREHVVPGQVIVICSWSADEPMHEVFAAAEQLPEVAFHITGNRAKVPLALAASVPTNVRLTGFLNNHEYDRLLCTSSAAVALSLRSDVLMRADHEAIAAGVPLVTSEGRTARSYLEGGAVFVDNHAGSIADGIRTALREGERLRSGMARLRKQWKQEWLDQAGRIAEELRLEVRVPDAAAPSVDRGAAGDA